MKCNSNKGRRVEQAKEMAKWGRQKERERKRARGLKTSCFNLFRGCEWLLSKGTWHEQRSLKAYNFHFRFYLQCEPKANTKEGIHRVWDGYRIPCSKEKNFF